MNIAIRLDAGGAIGLGHLMRCMSLADKLVAYPNVNVYFIMRNPLSLPIGYKVIYLDHGPLPSSASVGYFVADICDELIQLRDVLDQNKTDCLIVDHYGASDMYFEKASGMVDKVICIDDSFERNVKADAVINGNIYGNKSVYPNIPLQLLGGKYTLLRAEFQKPIQRIINSEVRRVYITSGGADPLGFCKTIATALTDQGQEVHVIVGSDFDNIYVRSLEELAVILHKNADMKKCMLDADIFVSSAGSTMYELAVCGTPSISFCLADDQKYVAEYVWKHDVSICGGNFCDYTKDMFLKKFFDVVRDYEKRCLLSKNGQESVSYSGAEAAAEALMTYINREGI